MSLALIAAEIFSVVLLSESRTYSFVWPSSFSLTVNFSPAGRFFTVYVYFPFPASVQVPFSTFAVVRSGIVTFVPLSPLASKVIVSRLLSSVPLIVLLTIRLPLFSTTGYSLLNATV